jgi:hypothetical protein
MRSNSAGPSRRLAVAQSIGQAAALVAPGFGPAGQRGGSRDQGAGRDQAVADGPAHGTLTDGTLRVIEQLAGDAEAGSGSGRLASDSR